MDIFFFVYFIILLPKTYIKSNTFIYTSNINLEIVLVKVVKAQGKWRNPSHSQALINPVGKRAPAPRTTEAADLS